MRSWRLAARSGRAGTEEEKEEERRKATRRLRPRDLTESTPLTTHAPPKRRTDPRRPQDRLHVRPPGTSAAARRRPTEPSDCRAAPPGRGGRRPIPRSSGCAAAGGRRHCASRGPRGLPEKSGPPLSQSNQFTFAPPTNHIYPLYLSYYRNVWHSILLAFRQLPREYWT